MNDDIDCYSYDSMMLLAVVDGTRSQAKAEKLRWNLQMSTGTSMSTDANNYEEAFWEKTRWMMLESIVQASQRIKKPTFKNRWQA